MNNFSNVSAYVFTTITLMAYLFMVALFIKYKYAILSEGMKPVYIKKAWLNIIDTFTEAGLKKYQAKLLVIFFLMVLPIVIFILAISFTISLYRIEKFLSLELLVIIVTSIPMFMAYSFGILSRMKIQ